MYKSSVENLVSKTLNQLIVNLEIIRKYKVKSQSIYSTGLNINEKNHLNEAYVVIHFVIDSFNVHYVGHSHIMIKDLT